MRSFTLIEIVVVISIILILTVLAFPNFHEANSKFALDRSIYKLSQDLRNAEEISMSARTTPLEFEGGIGPTFFPKGGYGLYFQEASSSYILFADCNGNGQYDAADDPPRADKCSEAEINKPYPEKMKDIALESGIKIGMLNPKYSTDNSLSVTFFPPDPKITIFPDASTAFITVFFGSKTEKTVSINSIGLIEIQ